jgi:hypothetical protein
VIAWGHDLFPTGAESLETEMLIILDTRPQ